MLREGWGPLSTPAKGGDVVLSFTSPAVSVRAETEEGPGVRTSSGERRVGWGTRRARQVPSVSISTRESSEAPNKQGFCLLLLIFLHEVA